MCVCKVVDADAGVDVDQAADAGVNAYLDVIVAVE